MLTAIEIENFKGIAARQRIEFAPLTLLFGANSAGKSTILQAILYLHEILERGSAEVDRTELGGHVVELGGFSRLVHQHDTTRTIVLRAEFATLGSLNRFERDLTAFPFPDVDDQVDSAWLEIEIRHRQTPTHRGPVVDQVMIGINAVAEPVVRIVSGESLRVGEPLTIEWNAAHPVICSLRARHPELWPRMREGAMWDGAPDSLLDERREFETELDHLSSIAVPTHVIERARSERSTRPEELDIRWRPWFAVVRPHVGALLPVGEPIRVVSAIDIEGDKEEIASLRRAPVVDENRIKQLQDAISQRERALQNVRTLIEMLVIGTTTQLADTLREATYIGPLRAIPPRGFLYERLGRSSSWADGLAAWESLLTDRDGLVGRTNDWLTRLDAGCRIVVQQLFDHGADAEQIGDGHVDKTIRRLLLDTGVGSLVLPSEVGAGISQLIPVVVAAVEGHGGLIVVEQPEIHVHPAVQVGLGDLLIEAVTRDSPRRAMMIETHSEHLILRLLRRIRETTEGELSEKAPAFEIDQLCVIYVESTPNGVRVRRLHVDEQGEFVDRWPKGFFAERMEELL